MLYTFVLLIASLGCAAILLERRRRQGAKPLMAIVESAPGITIRPGGKLAGNDHEEVEFGPLDDPGSYSVLIADDQSIIRAMLREWFERDGMRVFEACNGVCAVEAVRHNKIDYVLLDLQMPDMNGMDALKAIRSYNETVPVAIMTGFADRNKLAEAAGLGVGMYFTKPFDIDSVKKQVVRRMIKCREEAASG